MIRCERAQDLLQTDYLDEEISFQDKQLVEEHLKLCSACRELEKKLQTQRTSIRQMKKVPVPEHLWSNIRDTIITERLKQEAGFLPGVLERLKELFIFPRPAMVLATSVLSMVIIVAIFTNVATQRNLELSKQVTAEGIAGYNSSAKNESAIYDLGTGIEEYFL